MKKQTFVLWALTECWLFRLRLKWDYKTRAIVAEPKMFRLRNVRRCGVPKVPNMVIRSVCVIWV